MHDDAGRPARHREVPQQPGDRPAGDVHVRARLGQHHPAAGQPALQHVGVASGAWRTGRRRPAPPAVRRRGSRRCAGSRRSPGPGCRARPPARARRHGSARPRRSDRSDSADSSAVCGASSTTPAPSVSISASSSAAVGAATTLTTRTSASVRSVVPSGSATSAAWIWVPTARPSTETSICSGMLETSASTSMVFSSWVTRVSGRGVAGDDDLHLDDDLLAAADHQQVDVLDVGADRVGDHGLGQRELRACRRCSA